ncbi:MAG: histidine kinase [Cyanobacteria bacterium SID2]|nr:histidine kinase [Cyanobacteria bacterium SID2]MBP0006071.1 histidine kinase [Cyanobacteria bacterium SBC]
MLLANLPFQTSEIGNKLPKLSIFLIVLICAAPTLLNIVGVDFGTPQDLPDLATLSQLSPHELTDALHHTLSGSFTHTLLEWSAFCTAIFTVVLALAHFSLVRDITTPIIGITLFFAGTVDAFHTLTADRLIEAVADNQTLIPFTWAICRLSNVLLTTLGVGIFLATQPKKLQYSLGFVAALSAGIGMLTYATVHWCVTRETLPQTLFPDAFITRPWDLVPLVLFLGAGVFLYPRFYRAYPSLFSHALVISTIPNAVVQVHMAFGSEALFDNHFNIAHFLKIAAYVVPLWGLILDYIYTHQVAERTNAALHREVTERKQAIASLDRTQTLLREKNQHLQEVLQTLQKTQAQLVQTEKMSSLGQLVAGIAHEINNPVNFIYGNVIHTKAYVEDVLRLLQLYQEEFPEATPTIRVEIDQIELEYLYEDLPKALHSIETGADRIRQIVVSLRNFSRLDEASLKEVDVHEGIESTLLLLRSRLGNRVRVVKHYTDLPRIECYPSELNQVWMSILANAIDALSNNEIDRTPTVSIDTYSIGDRTLCVTVADNGPGMTPQVLEKVFDPFFSTKEIGKGTGLGLAITYQIVEKHRGTIEIDSQSGEGTRVTVKLPTSQTSIS